MTTRFDRLSTLRTIVGTWVLASAIAIVGSTAAAAATFDHSAFNTLLASAVRNGRVNYSAFRSSVLFTTYLRSLAAASVSSLSHDEILAFWINAYNACVIKNVIDHPGIKKPTDVKGFFDQIRFTVARRSVTLNNIENDIVRPAFNDPLIHFGLVCAAQSCPPLLSTAYTGATIRTMLRQNAVRYLAGSDNRWDASSKTLWLSKIFEWYAADFGGRGGIVSFVSRYGTTRMKEGVKAGQVTVKYLDYDWTLNSR